MFSPRRALEMVMMIMVMASFATIYAIPSIFLSQSGSVITEMAKLQVRVVRHKG